MKNYVKMRFGNNAWLLIRDFVNRSEKLANAFNKLKFLKKVQRMGSDSRFPKVEMCIRVGWDPTQFENLRKAKFVDFHP